MCAWRSEHGHQDKYLVTNAGVVLGALDLVLGVEGERVPQEARPVAQGVGPGGGGEGMTHHVVTTQ